MKWALYIYTHSYTREPEKKEEARERRGQSFVTE